METQVIVCNQTQVRVEFKAVTVRGVDHDGSCWFEFSGAEFKAIGRYSAYGSPVYANRSDNRMTEATKAAKAKLEEHCAAAVRQWVAAGGMAQLGSKRQAELAESVKHAKDALAAALEAVEAARIALYEAEEAQRAG